jgi:hypothetical protein
VRACIPVLVIRHANHIFLCGIMMSSVVRLALPFFQQFLKKKGGIEHKMRVLIYSATLPAKFLILQTIQRDIIINVHGSLRKFL